MEGEDSLGFAAPGSTERSPRFPRPLEPIDVSSTDTENFYRFPCGFVHVVRFGGDHGERCYAARVRDNDDNFTVLGPVTNDLGAVQATVQFMWLQILRMSLIGPDEDDLEVIYGGVERGAPRRASIDADTWKQAEAAIWPPVAIDSLGHATFEDLPADYLFPLGVSYDDGTVAWFPVTRQEDGSVRLLAHWKDSYEECVDFISWHLRRWFVMWDRHARATSGMDEPSYPSSAPKRS